MKLLPHQIKYAQGYKNKAFLVHETGTGKTICACVWLHDGRDDDALVICPKRVVLKWRDTLLAWGTKASVVSKEDFKKLLPRKYSALVVDEADEFASPLFTKSRSQLSTALYSLIQAHPETPVMLLTATPIRSNPWNLHTLLCYLGGYIEWRKWREEFFSLERRPYLRFPAWLPRPDWRQKIRPLLEKTADIVLLRDCVEYLPPFTEEIHKIYRKKDDFVAVELTPAGRFVEEHLFEQGDKVPHIIDIGRQFRKIIVVAHYVDQIETLAKELVRDRQVFMVHGTVKNQEQILKDAAASDECYLVVQASLGVGWDGDTFSCVVFASMSYKVRDYVQLKGRVRRIHNLHPVAYHYLIGGKCDNNVYKIIQAGRDFVPSEYRDE